LNLSFGLLASCQKSGIILANKLILKFILSKNVNNKKCALELVFLNEKKRERFGRFLT